MTMTDVTVDASEGELPRGSDHSYLAKINNADLKEYVDTIKPHFEGVDLSQIVKTT